MNNTECEKWSRAFYIWKVYVLRQAQRYNEDYEKMRWICNGPNYCERLEGVIINGKGEKSDGRDFWADFELTHSNLDILNFEIFVSILVGKSSLEVRFREKRHIWKFSVHKWHLKTWQWMRLLLEWMWKETKRYK